MTLTATEASEPTLTLKQIQPTQPKPPRSRKVVYPTRDGKPMAEDTRHRQRMSEFLDMMERHTADHPALYVAGNDFVYYEEGNNLARVSPDAYLARVAKGYRPNYKVWEEKFPPCFVLEFTSKKTKQEDVGHKFTLYEQILRVEEYVLFDPDGDYLTPRLQGYRLIEGRYVRITPENAFPAESMSGSASALSPAVSRLPLPFSSVWLYSATLDLFLVEEGDLLRLWNPVTGAWLKTSFEAEAEAKQQRQRADEEAQRAERAMQRGEREMQRAEREAQRADEEAQRADEEAQRADEEAQRADEEAQRADEEAQRAQSAEGEVARLKAELEALRRGEPGA